MFKSEFKSGRSVSFAPYLEFPIPSGSIYPRATLLGNIDNDDKNLQELAIGLTNGDLYVFKGKRKCPWMRCSHLGTIVCLGLGDLLDLGKNFLVVISNEGDCYLFDFRVPIQKITPKSLEIDGIIPTSPEISLESKISSIDSNSLGIRKPVNESDIASIQSETNPDTTGTNKTSNHNCGNTDKVLHHNSKCQVSTLELNKVNLINNENPTIGTVKGSSEINSKIRNNEIDSKKVQIDKILDLTMDPKTFNLNTIDMCSNFEDNLNNETTSSTDNINNSSFLKDDFKIDSTKLVYKNMNLKNTGDSSITTIKTNINDKNNDTENSDNNDNADAAITTNNDIISDMNEEGDNEGNSIYNGDKNKVLMLSKEISHSGNGELYKTVSIEPIYRWRIYENSTCVIICDIDEDGENELIIGFSSGNVCAYKIIYETTDVSSTPLTKICLKSTWQTPSPASSLDLCRDNMNHPYIIVGQCGRFYCKINHHGHITCHKFGNDGIIAPHSLDNNSGKSNIISCISPSKISGSRVEGEHSFHVLVGLDGTIQLQQEKGSLLLWSQHFPGKEFFTLDIFDFTGNGKQNIIACSWDGTVYVFDLDGNYIYFQIEERVHSFIAGRYSITGVESAPCFIFMVFNKIHIYYNLNVSDIVLKELTFHIDPLLEETTLIKRNPQLLMDVEGKARLIQYLSSANCDEKLLQKKLQIHQIRLQELKKKIEYAKETQVKK